MLRLLASRLLTTVLLLFVVSILVFLYVQLIPGDAAAASLGPGATAAEIDRYRAELGLDDPLLRQYWRWLLGALQGDLGRSLIDGTPVIALVREAYPITLTLTIGGMFVGVSTGLLLGVTAGLRPGSWTDRLVTIVAATTTSLPAFWLAMLLAIIFAGRLGWFSAVGYIAPGDSLIGWLRSVTLPSIALGLPSSALVARQMRSAINDVLQTTHIRAARAMGLRDQDILRTYVFRNALIPLFTIIGFQLAVVVGEVLVVENVFNMSGLGPLIVAAIATRNIYVVQSVFMMVALFIIFSNLLFEFGYLWLNPKVRVT